ncbi:MAG: hypothetical protein O8C61_03255 [Candidatus Methanoperedens sp.]|nr:hypothetical protein [Candidatus Methanoperedens sp.]
MSEVVADSKTAVNAQKDAIVIYIKEPASDSKAEGDGAAFWVPMVIGVVLLVASLGYLVYTWYTQKAGNNNTSGQYVDTGAATTTDRAQYVSVLSSGVGVR